MAADWLSVAGLGAQVLGLAILFFALFGSKNADSLRSAATVAVFFVLIGVAAQLADVFIEPPEEEYLYVVFRHWP